MASAARLMSLYGYPTFVKLSKQFVEGFSTHNHMIQGYYIKPAATAEGIWFIFDPAGALIGSCSTRENALGIVALVNGRASAPEADAREEHSSTVRVGPMVNRPEEETLSPPASKGTAAVKPMTLSSTMFDWYQPPQRASIWSFLKKVYQ